MTRILVLYYSQTGQLTQAVKSMLAPLENNRDVEIVWEHLKPKKPYPFPWPFLDFLDVLPECMHMIPPEMETVSFDPDSHFDLIVLAYQVWFLSPSLPVIGFLKSPAVRVLKDTPVITLIACRNMWLCAQEKVKTVLKSLGARLIDNVVLVDQGPPLATFVTTPRWLLTGKKGGFWGIFPPAGVSERDIANTMRFGRAIAESLPVLKSKPGASLLWGLGAVKVNPSYIAIEKIAHRSFYIWGRLFRAIGHAGNPWRKVLLMIYAVFLITMILTVVPLDIVIIHCIKPLFYKKLNAQVVELEKPSGSSMERTTQYIISDQKKF